MQHTVLELVCPRAPPRASTTAAMVSVHTIVLKTNKILFNALYQLQQSRTMISQHKVSTAVVTQDQYLNS